MLYLISKIIFSQIYEFEKKYLSIPSKARAPKGPSRFNWGPPNVLFGKTHFWDLNIGARIFNLKPWYVANNRYIDGFYQKSFLKSKLNKTEKMVPFQKVPTILGYKWHFLGLGKQPKTTL